MRLTRCPTKYSKSWFNIVFCFSYINSILFDNLWVAWNICFKNLESSLPIFEFLFKLFKSVILFFLFNFLTYWIKKNFLIGKGGNSPGQILVSSFQLFALLVLLLELDLKVVHIFLFDLLDFSQPNVHFFLHQCVLPDAPHNKGDHALDRIQLEVALFGEQLVDAGEFGKGCPQLLGNIALVQMAFVECFKFLVGSLECYLDLVLLEASRKIIAHRARKPVFLVLHICWL